MGLSPLLILTLCGPERVLVVSTEPLFDYSGGRPSRAGGGGVVVARPPPPLQDAFMTGTPGGGWGAQNDPPLSPDRSEVRITGGIAFFETILFRPPVVSHHQSFETTLFGLACHESPFPRPPTPPSSFRGLERPPPPPRAQTVVCPSMPPPCVTFRLVVAPLRGPGQSPVLPFACCVGSLLCVGRCGRCSCWCRFRVRGDQ